MKRFSIKGIWPRLISGAILLLLCVNFIGAAPVSGKFTPNTSADNSFPADYQSFFDSFLSAQMEEEDIAGAAVAVVQNGEIAFSKGYGYANIDAGIPVQVDETLFFIGSDGKLFTWTAVMQLAEQGKVDLHADVNTYLDFEIPAAFGEPITLHHLMTHTAGFEENSNSLLRDDPKKVLPLREHLLRYMPARVYPPGVVSAYSNYGTALAGYIIERVSGQTFEAYITEHLLQPLGMDHTFAGNTVPPALSSDLSRGYRFEKAGFTGLDFEWTAAVPCAPIRTTMTDLSRFMIAHLNDGCVDGSCILRPETVRQMHALQFTHHPKMTGMAYGFLMMDMNGQRVLWHQGESARFITLLMLIPEQNMGLVVSWNTSPVHWREMMDAFLNTFFPANRPPLEAQPLPGWEERAARFNGTYVSSRISHTTPEILVGLQSAGNIRMDQGKITFNGWDFVETEPGVFHQVSGDRVLVLQEDEAGTRWLFMGPLAFFQVPWYRTLGFILPLVGSCLVVFLSAWIAWPVGALRRKGLPTAGGAASWLAAGLGLFELGLFAVLVIALLATADRFVFHQEWVQLISGLSWLAVPWSLCVIGFALRAWVRREWSLGRRIHYTLTGAAGLALLWLLWNINLL